MKKELLIISPILSKTQIATKFHQLAELFFNQYEIVKGNKCYNFLEIEFYFYSQSHKDTTTYQRNMPAGQWHTHLSGVDVTFESNNEYYGGILIRSIIDNEGNVINGPLCTLFELFDNIDIDGNNINIPRIRKKEKRKTIHIEATTRFNINSGEYKDCYYRYYNASKEIKWKSGYTANPMRFKQPK